MAGPPEGKASTLPEHHSRRLMTDCLPGRWLTNVIFVAVIVPADTHRFEAERNSVDKAIITRRRAPSARFPTQRKGPAPSRAKSAFARQETGSPEGAVGFCDKVCLRHAPRAANAYLDLGSVWSEPRLPREPRAESDIPRRHRRPVDWCC
jgi:hypothetical protein